MVVSQTLPTTIPTRLPTRVPTIAQPTSSRPTYAGEDLSIVCTLSNPPKASGCSECLTSGCNWCTNVVIKETDDTKTEYYDQGYCTNKTQVAAGCPTGRAYSAGWSWMAGDIQDVSCSPFTYDKVTRLNFFKQYWWIFVVGFVGISAAYLVRRKLQRCALGTEGNSVQNFTKNSPSNANDGAVHSGIHLQTRA